jgi:hypothetical protein
MTPTTFQMGVLGRSKGLSVQHDFFVLGSQSNRLLQLIVEVPPPPSYLRMHNHFPHPLFDFPAML